MPVASLTMQREQWRSQGSATAVAVLIILFLAVAAADALGDDGEFASLSAAVRPLLLATGNTSLAPESDWGLTLERHGGGWIWPDPKQLSLPLLTGTRTLQATPSTSSQLGCLKCELDRIVSRLGDTQLEFKDIFMPFGRNYGLLSYRDERLRVNSFQRGIVEGMQELYDRRVTDQHTGDKLLNWAVSTYHEPDRFERRNDYVTTGPRIFDPAAAAACDIDANSNVPDNPCLKGGSLHTTWTSPTSDIPARSRLLVHVYLWWWPADEKPDYLLNGPQRNELIVQLAQISRKGAEAAAGPGASNSAGTDAELLRRMERRARAAKAFSRAVALCTALPQGRPSIPEEPFDAPLELTTIQVCVQERISSVLGAPRGILVVFKVETAEYNPSGHLYRSDVNLCVTDDRQLARALVRAKEMPIRVIMLPSRWALGVNP